MVESPFEPIDAAINASAKLDRIIAQADVIASSEHPNADSKAAVADLRAQAEVVKRRFANYALYPINIKLSLLKQANYIVIRLTDILGFIVRSTTTRNLFELYFPFKELARSLVGNDVRLIISSDWRFSPFTYPFGLDELPSFVLIGLPASESENALIFPTAGHELGHNIWRANDFTDKYRTDIENCIYRAYESNKSQFELTFSLKGADIRNDMFVQPIIRQSVTFALRQIEELFCDAIGVLLFGQSYMYAFDYLISPSVSGRRVGEYPNTQLRVKYIIDFANDIDIKLGDFASRFTPESFSGVESADFIIQMADAAVADMVKAIFNAARNYVDKNSSHKLVKGKEGKALACFELGRPTADVMSLGDLINAAWRVYNEPARAENLKDHGVELIPFLTDLVIKSAENFEFKSFHHA